MCELVLEIDYREKAVINLINTYKDEHKEQLSFEYTVNNLIIGDFIIKDKVTNNVLYIIERKTILDLAASIIDGRFREQKQRLLDSTNGCYDKIIYILEGSKALKKYGNISKTIIDSSILNLIFKHKYKVLHTDNEKDTLEYLIHFCKKIHQNDFDKPSLVEFKNVKKGDNTDSFVNMLCTIPGVSSNVAKKIKERYTSLADLFNEYTKTDTKEDLLSDIQINKRRLGKALSNKIYCYLFNKNNDNNNKKYEECLL